MRTIGSKIIVKAIIEEAKTASGIILDSSSAPKELKAQVIVVGPACETIKEGDIIYYSKFNTQEFQYKNTDYLILLERDVLAIE